MLSKILGVMVFILITAAITFFTLIIIAVNSSNSFLYDKLITNLGFAAMLFGLLAFILSTIVKEK